jgi:biopolymer transport protein ExbB/TolQ
VSESITLQRPVPAPAARQGRLPRYFAVLIWAPPLCIVLGAMASWHFVSFAFVSNPALNGLILAVLCCGCVTMVNHVRRVYREDAVFHAGLDWLRLGAWSDEPDPTLGPNAHVLGMLGRLEKLGLGHQVYMQSTVMEPELKDLEAFFEKRQELSQFIVGLMVGLGLLGTFVGLLETLINTSTLISTIANSVGGSSGGGGMESEFARIVGGLQKPLESMGTAFSASMFGLIGSIMLGFQMILVRKTVGVFVDRVREEVLSLAEKTKVNANVEITERFLATLLADILEQHRQTVTRLDGVSAQLAELVPQVREAALSSAGLNERLRSQEEVLERTVSAVASVRDVVPVLGELASASSGVFRESREASDRVARMLEFLPGQTQMLEQLKGALGHVGALSAEVDAMKQRTGELLGEVQAQNSVVKRLDATLWNNEKAELRKLLEAD